MTFFGACAIMVSQTTNRTPVKKEVLKMKTVIYTEVAAVTATVNGKPVDLSRWSRFYARDYADVQALMNIIKETYKAAQTVAEWYKF